MPCGCGCGSENKGNFKLANMNENDNKKLKDLEEKFKTETGKDMVLIAWEKQG